MSCWMAGLSSTATAGAGGVDGGGDVVDGTSVDGGAVEGGAVEGGAVEGGAVEGGAVEGGAVEGGAMDAADMGGGDVDAAQRPDRCDAWTVRGWTVTVPETLVEPPQLTVRANAINIAPDATAIRPVLLNLVDWTTAATLSPGNGKRRRALSEEIAAATVRLK